MAAKLLQGSSRHTISQPNHNKKGLTHEAILTCSISYRNVTFVAGVSKHDTVCLSAVIGRLAGV